MATRKRKAAAAAAPEVITEAGLAGGEAGAALAQARTRKRSRCRHVTTYTHDNLCSWLKSVLPDGFAVQPPPDPLCVPGADAVAIEAPSGFPHDNSAAAQAGVLALLSATPELDAEDLIDGHCETVACVTAERFLKELDADAAGAAAAAGAAGASGAASGRAPVDVALAAYGGLASDLKKAGVEGQVGILFGPQKRAEGEATRGAMWDALAPPEVRAHLPGAGEDVLFEMCAGVSARIGSRLERAVASAGGRPFAVPLYVINYIWDGDELTAAELRKNIETACYSIHAIGLVIDPARRDALLADPNGPLLRGGSMEFLSIPVAKLPKGLKPTTSQSQWDRDEPKRRRAESGGGGGAS